MAYDTLLTDEELAIAQHRTRQMIALQALEGNPYDAEDLAMFEMFDRERWSHERVLDYIRASIVARIASSDVAAAE